MAKKAMAWMLLLRPWSYAATVVPFLVAASMFGVRDGADWFRWRCGLLDGLRNKGIHIAIQSGIAAAEAIAAGGDDVGVSYFALLKKTRGYREVKRVKNVHGGFTYGAPIGVAMAGLAWATFGALPCWMFGKSHKDSSATKPIGKKGMKALPAVGVDRLTDVFMSGTIHEENQPCHLKILDAAKCKACEARFASPCTRFCPAEVYRVDDGVLQVDFSNCLHCKTCRIKCPMENIDWTFPQGGDGPRYTRM